MHVKPEVSKGAVNPDTGLPESQTAELETDVMLNDGQGMVIGGLIKENDSMQQSKVPYLGNVRGIGWLFRRTEQIKERVEIIVAIVPRVQPYDCNYQAFEQGELVKASVPLCTARSAVPIGRGIRFCPMASGLQYPLIPPKHVPPQTGYYHDEMPNYFIPQIHCQCSTSATKGSSVSSVSKVDRDWRHRRCRCRGATIAAARSRRRLFNSTHLISDQPIVLKRSPQQTSGSKK